MSNNEIWIKEDLKEARESLRKVTYSLINIKGIVSKVYREAGEDDLTPRDRDKLEVVSDFFERKIQGIMDRNFAVGKVLSSLSPIFNGDDDDSEWAYSHDVINEAIMIMVGKAELVDIPEERKEAVSKFILFMKS